MLLFTINMINQIGFVQNVMVKLENTRNMNIGIILMVKEFVIIVIRIVDMIPKRGGLNTSQVIGRIVITHKVNATGIETARASRIICVSSCHLVTNIGDRS